jgi:DNA-binding LacI/PurR family transcriptional regulator
VAVPQQLSVVGFGDAAADPEFPRKLTTVTYDNEWMGEKAANMLLDLVEQKSRLSCASATVRPRLSEGETTAPARR